MIPLVRYVPSLEGVMIKRNHDLRTAASVGVRCDLENKTATFHFQTEGKDHIVVTTPLHELERLYRNIDEECHTRRKPFAPVSASKSARRWFRRA